MKHKHKYLLLIMVLNGYSAMSQTLTRTSSTERVDSVYATYHWEVHAGQHGAQIDLILFKNMTYKYYSSYPLANFDSSQGFYKIIKNKLILNSYLQKDSVQADIRYVDTSLTSLGNTKLFYPKNNKGETIYSANYNLNYDTTSKNVFHPFWTTFNPAPRSITAIKVNFGYNDFSTPWIPIQPSDKNIVVILKTDLNFDDYIELVFTNKEYIIRGKKLLEVKPLRPM